MSFQVTKMTFFMVLYSDNYNCERDFVWKTVHRWCLPEGANRATLTS